MAKVKTMALTGGFSGRLGNVVLVEQPTGTVMRERVIPRNPRTPAQTSWRTAMKEAGLAYRQLDSAQFLAWQAYAFQLAPAGSRTTPVVQLFMKLSAKAYQAHVALGLDPVIALDPPSVPFGGDSVGVSVSAIVGGIEFSASHPNQAGTATELLVQAVTSPFAATYEAHYRSKAFVAFGSGSLSAQIELRPGWYACAVRFVRISTGEQTLLLPLGTIQV